MIRPWLMGVLIFNVLACAGNVRIGAYDLAVVFGFAALFILAIIASGKCDG